MWHRLVDVRTSFKAVLMADSGRLFSRFFQREPRFEADAGPHQQVWLLLCAAVVLLAGCGTQRDPESQVDIPSKSSELAEAFDTNDIDPETVVRKIVASEELILEITPRLQHLIADIENLSLPSQSRSELFQREAVFFDTQGEALNAKRLWTPLFDEIAYVDDAKIAIESARFLDTNWSRFLTETTVALRARKRAGPWLSVEAVVDLVWQRDPSSPTNAWKITQWRNRRFDMQQRDHLMFEEVLDQAVPTLKDRQHLRESRHYHYATKHYYPKLKARLPATGLHDARFFPVSTATHPGLAVVDIDDDGWDDLYVMQRWGKNMLLRNRGDGAFDEVAEQYGLDIDGRSNAGVFADFDNDGDPDLILARSFERSMYLVNDEGQFKDHSKLLVTCPLPYEATSVTAADYNGDGLLDVYFCTYHQDDINRRLDADLSHPDHRIHTYLSEEHSAELTKRFSADTRSYVNQVGPPNILLANRGGRFELASQNPQLAIWKNSFQASWADYDEDGDVDVYVANDFAADNLLRNDGEKGFKDVTLEQGIDQIGFAMGVSWGDYDGDGRQDLYVSNMFSKAGRRITANTVGVDPRIFQLAMGNYLYRNTLQGFELVSGLNSGDQPVARAGWSWGGQFVDLDNDGDLDLYVPNGYYSVPPAFETAVDL